MDRMRSWMFVPGHSPKMMDKAMASAVDVAMFDLEDGVVPALKAESRPLVAAALGPPGAAGGPLRYVRINGTTTEWHLADLEAVTVPGLAGLTVPKVETAEEVRALAARLDLLEHLRGIAPGTVRLMLAIETAAGLLAAPALAAASPRVSGLMFGAEDYSRDINLPAVRTGIARDFIHARSAIVVAATAAGLPAIDGVWPDLKDDEGLAADSAMARALGFLGKSLVHPGQIAVVNAAFSPSAEEVAYARDLAAEFEKAVGEGQGSISFRGKLVDRPIYARAVATLRLAERIAAA
ncbi:MAG: citrate (pro-3S)-lyase subunit beta [Thalassobaculales bacterium]